MPHPTRHSERCEKMFFFCILHFNNYLLTPVEKTFPPFKQDRVTNEMMYFIVVCRNGALEHTHLLPVCCEMQAHFSKNTHYTCILFQTCLWDFIKL